MPPKAPAKKAPAGDKKATPTTSPKKKTESAATAPTLAASSPAEGPLPSIQESKDPANNDDFEAGFLYKKYQEQYGNNFSAEQFRKMWKEFKDITKHEGKTQERSSKAFEAGFMFSKFDSDGDGRLSKAEFEEMVRKYPDVLRSNVSGGDHDARAFDAGVLFSKFDRNNDGNLDKEEFEKLVKAYPGIANATGHKYGDPLAALSARPEYPVPLEMVSGRLLSHYDETAGVAISNTAVEQHKNLGNRVVPLLESYRTRYERLRALLTSKLLPRREHLLQLRRQLQNTSSEVAAVRKGIERETLADSEQILERLRGAESMRQSSIMHQIIQIEEELQAIERLVRRVEQANEDSPTYVGTGVLLTSAVPGKTSAETIHLPRAVGMVELIQQFSDLAAQIDRLSTKPVSVQIDYPTDDFPRETAERLEIIARCDRYIHALSVKDHILWTALQEKKQVDDHLEEERRLSHEYANEVASWAELTHHLSKELEASKEQNEKLERRNQELIDILRKNNLYYVVSKSEVV